MEHILQEHHRRIASPDEKKDSKGNVIYILPQGTVIKERYELTYLTAGGMGIIYKARDKETGLDCIIKEILITGEEELYLKSILREKDMLSKFYHPGIVNLLDFFQLTGGFYLVLEFIDGLPADEHIKRNHKDSKVPLNKILYWSLQLCNILEYIHSMSPPVIYRDLKPENILIDSREKIKLIDFGIARTYKEQQLKDTEPVGSPGFASPEQYGRSQTDVRSDIYSLGALLHYFLTGLDPREREKSFIFEPVRKINKDIPKQMEHIISKSLSLKPEDRFQHIGEMKNSLQEIAKDYPWKEDIGGEEIQEEYEEEKPVKKSPGYLLRTISFICADLIMLFLIYHFIIPQTAGIAEGMTSGLMVMQWEDRCRSNICHIAASIDKYAEDHNGLYPADLNSLERKYINILPVCPHSRKGYSYDVSDKRDNFTLYCSVPGSHPDYYLKDKLDLHKKERYPQYTPGNGLVTNWRTGSTHWGGDIKSTENPEEEVK